MKLNKDTIGHIFYGAVTIYLDAVCELSVVGSEVYWYDMTDRFTKHRASFGFDPREEPTPMLRKLRVLFPDKTLIARCGPTRYIAVNNEVVRLIPSKDGWYEQDGKSWRLDDVTITGR